MSDRSTISYPIHSHVSMLIIGMVLEGSILLETGNGSRIYDKEQTFAVLPYAPHGIQANHTAYTMLSLCIRKSMFYDCDRSILKEKLAGLLSEALRSRQIGRGTIARLLGRLDSFDDSAVSMTEKIGNPLIVALKEQIEQCPARRISTLSMAENVYVSQYHFIRCFKREFGLTPHQFQIQNRVRMAQRLLCQAETDTKVALSTGFCDQSHFIKNFKKYVGLTPTAYKKSCGIIRSVFADHFTQA